jgi:peptidoglycan/LPS O-acetylase OafA/YrhL
MGFDATTRRRWLGILVLIAALAMLIAGETVLQGRLQNVPFVLYWLLCLILTAAAIIIAFLDARALRRQTREEARDLLQSTLKEIETDAKARRGQPRR